jgi:hypothetical protein
MERIIELVDVLENIVNCDETWIFQYEPNRNRPSTHWKTPFVENENSKKDILK